MKVNFLTSKKWNTPLKSMKQLLKQRKQSRLIKEQQCLELRHYMDRSLASFLTNS